MLLVHKLLFTGETGLRIIVLANCPFMKDNFIIGMRMLRLLREENMAIEAPDLIIGLVLNHPIGVFVNIISLEEMLHAVFWFRPQPQQYAGKMVISARAVSNARTTQSMRQYNRR